MREFLGVFLIFTIVLSLDSAAVAQSKKQQIFILKGKLDSLKEENTRKVHDLEVSRKLEVRNKHEIDSLKNVCNILERKLNANKVTCESELKHLQRQLDSADLNLKKRQRDLDSITSLPENSLVLSDSVKLVYFTKSLISTSHAVASSALGDLNSDGFIDMVIIMQNRISETGSFQKGEIKEGNVFLNIYFWNEIKKAFDLEYSNSKFVIFWELMQGEDVVLEIHNNTVDLMHSGASGSHYQSEKFSFSYNKKSLDFFVKRYEYSETLFNSGESYDYSIDFESRNFWTSNGENQNINIPKPSLKNFPDANWKKAMNLVN